MSDYRTRIYQNYVNSRNKPLAPQNIEGLEIRSSRLKQLILNHFPKNQHSKILDLGCGHGAIIYFARQMGYPNITGVDTSFEQVESAKQLGIEGVQHGDLNDTLRLTEEGSLDVVITYDVIEHFRKEELIHFTDEVHRVLKRGGMWIIHVPNGGSIFCNSVLYGDFTHEIAFTHTSITQLLKACGFKQVKCFEECPPVNGFKGAIRYVLWKLIRWILKFYLAVETGGMGKDSIFSQNFITVAFK